ncbi:MAG: acetyl-CoA carboxylase biotin carboxyl carrier protein subunit [Bacteroidetes bacterium]|nr:MAG: acetyl-CoA carboxylase biotin carboxyl carrier protein subunit [Bacteroidota bacterium]
MYNIKIHDKDYLVDINTTDTKNGKINNNDFSLDMINTNKNTFHIINDNKSYNAEIVDVDYKNKKAKIKINSSIYDLEIKDDIDILLKSLGMSDLTKQKVNNLKAPMPGMVYKILVSNRQEVKTGDTLIVLEAMKMENNLKSPTNGIIKKVVCSEGTSVDKNEILLEFE